LPAFGVRQQGLERISFSSQPLNPLDHPPAGLIEVEAETCGEETKNEDQCDKQLRCLWKRFTKTCERHSTTEVNCRTEAKDTIEHSAKYYWQNHLASTVLDDGRTPVFWAGFWPGGEEGIDTREALADFISSPSINGFQLADTEWGQAAESPGADNLAACTWDRKKAWWNVASKKLAEAMALHKVKNITIALHKNMKDPHRTFYNSLLYQAELPNMGSEMWKNPTWNPEFEVFNLKVPGSGTNTNCVTASAMREQLELHAGREVKVWCRSCSGKLDPATCTKPRPVRKRNNINGKCIKGNCQNGKGEKAWPNGDRYEGGWKNGTKNGLGNYTWSGGKMKYQGEYKDDLFDGQGNFTWTNGDTYQGGWKNDLKDGWGTYTYANGKIRYQGQYKEGLQDGQGTFTDTNGEKYKGGFKKDLKDGKGTVTLANGEKYKVVYKKGQLKKKVPLNRR